MAFDISSFGIAESSLPNGWKTDRIGSLADINPEQVGRAYPHSTIAYLDIGNVASGSIGQPETMPIHNAPSRAKRLVRSEDIIISTVRPGNRAYAFMREIPDNLVVSTGFAVLRAKDLVNPRFLYHLATSKPLIEYWASIADEKSAYPSINPSDIAECVVPIPPLLEQNAIAHILGTLDEKIDLNRHINQTLEAMAQAIFKSWFVDFDPVKAKIAAIEQGQDPLRAAMRVISGKTDAELDQMPREHHDQLAATAALFPDAMEELELGEIPKGWEVKRVGDLIELAYGKALKSTDRQKGAVPVYGSGGITGYHNEALVPHGAIIVGRKGTVGSLYWEDEPFFPIDTTYYVKPKSVPLTYCYYAMEALALDRMNTDAAVPGLNRENVYRLELVVPDAPVLGKFDAVVATLRKDIRANSVSNKSLAALRDTLLPKLLSGELHVNSMQEEIA